MPQSLVISLNACQNVLSNIIKLFKIKSLILNPKALKGKCIKSMKVQKSVTLYNMYHGLKGNIALLYSQGSVLETK